MLGAFLKSLRRSSSLSQSQAGQEAKLSRNRVVDIEKDKYPYSVDKLSTYAAALGYDLEFHFTKKGDWRECSVYKFKE